MDTKKAGRMGGISKSTKKVETARANGKKGGRPTKLYKEYEAYLKAGGQLTLAQYELLEKKS